MKKLSIVLIAFATTVGVLESAGRILRVDFDKLKSTPFYIQRPHATCFAIDGQIFWRRPDDFKYEGVIYAFDRKTVLNPHCSMQYDHDGFRNDPDMKDWKNVICGDSFVELVNLSNKDLFTAKLGSTKNLGISHSGPLTYNYMLQQYGKSQSTKNAVMVFYEGNDLKDLKEEYGRKMNFLKTGERSYENIMSGNHSFVKAVWRYAYWNWIYKDRTHYSSFHGNPVTFTGNPFNDQNLTGEEISLLKIAFSEWKSACDDLKLKPFVLFMPSKERVMGEYVSPPVSYGGSYDLIRTISLKENVQWLDATPVLKQCAANGVSPYILFGDGHLSQEGSDVIFELLKHNL